MKLADTPDLGSGARACRFKSCHPHHHKPLETSGFQEVVFLLRPAGSAAPAAKDTKGILSGHRGSASVPYVYIFENKAKLYMSA